MWVEVVLGTALAILLYLSFFQKPKGLPPGRWGLPLIGYLPLNGKSIEEQATLLRKQYGDIFLWRMGTQVVVFVNNFKLTKEVFASKSFTDRPGWDMITLEEKVPLGVFASNGHIWQTNRRFTLRQLRDRAWITCSEWSLVIQNIRPSGQTAHSHPRRSKPLWASLPLPGLTRNHNATKPGSQYRF
nr:cytochrome P450 2L1-like [Penaeus vannamei]